MGNVCIYLRKSRADEEMERNGIETLSKHRDILLEFAKERKLSITKIYQEIATGESLLHRPEMLQLLKDVENNEYSSVLVMDIDRLGRGNMQEQGLILETFKKSNTKIVTPRKTYDLQDEFDEEYSEFEAFMARKELKITTRRMQRGRLRSVKDGNYIGTYAPFGYKIEGVGKNRLLIPDEENALIVKLIFDLYVSGLGGNKIAHKLNSMGYKSATGIDWSGHAVINIIKNLVYVGKVTWGKRKYETTTENPSNLKVELLPREDWTVADGKHEPIVSFETFQKAQHILSTRTHAPYFKELTNPLAGIIICGHCGASMMYRPYKNQDPFITCYKCNYNKSSKFKFVHDRLLDTLKEWIYEYKVELSKLEKNETKNHMLEVYGDSLKTLEIELGNLEKQKNNLHDFLERGIYDIDTYLDRSENISARIQSTKHEIESTKLLFEKEERKRIATSKTIPKIEKALDIYYTLETAQSKNRLLKTLVSKAVYIKAKNQRNDNFSLTVYPSVDKENY